MTRNNQIKKEAVCYTPACEWPTAIFSQASVPQPAPIITGVMRLNKLTAIGGIFGAMTMFVGDVLLYAHWGPVESLDQTIVSRIPFRTSILLANELQLDISALLGILAIIGYCFGALHIYQRFDAGLKFLGVAAASLFALGTLFGGAYHALWSMYGKVLQASMVDPASHASLLDSLKNTLDFMNTAAAIPVMLSLLVLVAVVVMGKTSFPRFFAVLTPLPLIVVSGMLLTPLAEVVNSPYSSLIKGTNFNIVMIIFFASSLIQLTVTNNEGASYVEDAA